MTDDGYASIRDLVWKANIPGIVLALYFDHIRAFPAWKRTFPHYLHPSILDVSQPAADKIEVITTKNRYLFGFQERETLVSDAADFVKTGVLEVFCDGFPVLRLSVSPSDSESSETDKRSWMARGVDDFTEGDWMDELTQLAKQLVAFEDEQRRKEQERREEEAKCWAKLKNTVPVTSSAVQHQSWLQRLLKR